MCKWPVHYTVHGQFITNERICGKRALKADFES
jgi:hypothetical protein